MSNKVQVPKLRFKGFEDEWESYKLKDVADIVGGGTPSTQNKQYWNGDINWFSPVEIGNDIYVSNSQQKITDLGLKKSSAKLLPVGTILYTSRAGIGKTAILAKESTTNQGFQSIIPKGNQLDTYFGYTMSNQFKQYGEKMGSGSTFLEISGKQLAKMPLLIPNINEQQKIGDFFAKLDRLIGLYNQKLKLKLSFKRGLIKSTFPNGNKSKYFPHLRFKFFKEKWVKLLLKDVANIVGGATPSTKNDKYWNGDINWFTPAEIGGNIYVYSSKKKITKEGLIRSSAKLLPPGTVLYTSRAGIGKTSILGEESTTNQGFQSIIPKESLLDTYFIYTMSDELKNYGERMSSGSTFLEISNKEFSKMNLMLPTFTEQQKIGQLFNKIDLEISLYSQKIDYLKQLKKAYLQKMFC